MHSCHQHGNMGPVNFTNVVTLETLSLISPQKKLSWAKGGIGKDKEMEKVESFLKGFIMFPCWLANHRHLICNVGLPLRGNFVSPVKSFSSSFQFRGVEVDVTTLILCCKTIAHAGFVQFMPSILLVGTLSIYR